MTALEEKNAQSFANLWGVQPTNSKEAARAWMELLNTVAADGGFLTILKSENREKVIQQLHQNAGDDTRRSRNKTLYGHIFHWLQEHGRQNHPEWKSELEKSPTTQAFDQNLRRFFKNMKRLMSGEKAKPVDKRFWPWFLGVLELGTPQNLTPLPHLRQRLTALQSQFARPFAGAHPGEARHTQASAPHHNLPADLTPKPLRWSNSFDIPPYLIAFYCPKPNNAANPKLPWDTACNAGFLGNFWDVSKYGGIKMHFGTLGSYTFSNAEAAFQATKLTTSEHLQTMSKKTGEEAFSFIKDLKKSNPDQLSKTYGNFGDNVTAMNVVLQNKFELRHLHAALVATGDAFLLEHNERENRDFFWSDNNDGTGANALGWLLMKLRNTFVNLAKYSWLDDLKVKVVKRKSQGGREIETQEIDNERWKSIVKAAASFVQTNANRLQTQIAKIPPVVPAQ